MTLGGGCRYESARDRSDLHIDYKSMAVDGCRDPHESVILSAASAWIERALRNAMTKPRTIATVANLAKPTFDVVRAFI